ncbi:methyl-accepting chemotaxis protein [Mesoaciditoga lauensis]|uniref:methyl-accepting chemotaxis protein n=1 Tax=Mesoaciditoga lauensis TaxID=1495039 RepID=UPI0005651929|nr:methyl-accepting chemotaxis protein [Mesoaciditoga lauensis]
MAKEKWRKSEKRKFRNLLIVIAIIIGLAPAITIGVFSYYRMYGSFMEQLKTSQVNTVHLDAQILNQLFTTDKSIIGHTAKDPRLLAAPTLTKSEFESPENTLRKYFQTTVDDYSFFSSIYIGTKNGNFFIYPKQNLPQGYDPRVRPWYKSAMNSDGPIVTEPYKDASTGKWVMTAADKVVDKNGNVIGVIGGDVFLDALNGMLKSAQLTPHSYLAILSADGKVLVDPHPELIGLNLAKYDWGKKIVEEKEGGLTYTLEGVRKFVSFTPLSNGWIAMIITPISDISAMVNHMRNIAILMIALIGGASIIVLVFVMNYATAPLKEFTILGNKFEENDLTYTLSTKRNDEIGDLFKRFNQALLNVRNIIKAIASSSEKVGEVSDVVGEREEELSKITDEISTFLNKSKSDFSNMASSVEETNASIEEIASASQTLAKAAQEASEAASSIDETIKELSHIAVSAKNSMTNTENSSMETAKIAEGLDESSKKIGEIVDAINKIAEQTNLLALNAAIEAARAGEAGKGFAVVAEEIRGLAEETKQSTANISRIIEEVQEKTSQAVQATKESTQSVSESAEQVDEMTTKFEEIASNINQITSTIENIAAASEEQSASTEEITSGITDLTNRMQGLDEEMEKLAQTVSRQGDIKNDLAKAVEELQEAYKAYKEQLSKLKYE